MSKKKSTPTNVEEQQPAEIVQEVPSITAEEQIAELNNTITKLTEENAKLQKTINRLQGLADKAETYLTQLVAMKNDFESYKRRMKLNAELNRQEGVESVALKLIEIVDTFEIAQKHLTDADTLKAFQMVYEKFITTLHGFGIVAMDVLGQPFDHNTMNALSKLDYGAEQTDKVVEVYKNGYLMGEKVLRYAEVIVGA